jgi:large subunit ribosomal protein L21
MYAIVEIAGQQFKVAKDQKVYVHRLQEEEGKKISFDNVLLLEDGSDITIGAPAIDGAAVEAKVVKHLKGDKVIVFKKKRRKGFRKKNGHRQYLTELLIEGIIAKGAVKTSPAKEKSAAPKKAESKKAAEPATEKTAPKVKAGKKSETVEDLSKNTVAELREMAKAKGLEGYSGLKKAELIAALSNLEKK